MAGERAMDDAPPTGESGPKFQVEVFNTLIDVLLVKLDKRFMKSQSRDLLTEMSFLHLSLFYSI